MWKPIGSSTQPDEVSGQRKKNFNNFDDLSQLKHKGKKRKGCLENFNSPDKNTPNIKKNYKRLHVNRSDLSPLRKKIGDDFSPPRKRKDNDGDLKDDGDISPPRKGRDDGDLSPPRKRKDDVDLSPPRKRKDDGDLSPPRKRKDDGDISPPRKRKDDDGDSSPKKRKDNDGDLSPPRKRKNNYVDLSPPRKSSKTRYSTVSSTSIPENPTREVTKKSFSREPSLREKSDKPEVKMQKTLDGKKAGLLSTSKLLKETEEFKRRENELFANMSVDVSGENVAPILRDRKTGKKRNLEQEAQKQLEKEIRENETKEKYSRWGKGLKQVEEQNKKVADDLHEMNKPLARYADDEDLETFLKEQEREGDPMLEYIRKKKRKKAIEEGNPEKPRYMGEFMPNRFGIIPGHRWDGVDRSNGYETKWFQVQNAKKAQLEEVYKWSTEDM